MINNNLTEFHKFSPSQCIQEHDEVDTLAGEAAARAIFLRGRQLHKSYGITYQVERKYVATLLLQYWQEKWNSFSAMRPDNDFVSLQPEFHKFSPSQWMAPRNSSSLRCRLRHGCSALADTLFHCGRSTEQKCECGAPIEDRIHYLCECPLYQVQRYEWSCWVDMDITEGNLPYLLGMRTCDKSMEEIVSSLNRFISSSGRFR